jgi:hypothetical protein
MSRSLRINIAVLLSTLLFAAAAGAADPVDPAGTTWVGAGVVKFKSPGAGTTSIPIEFELLFGPNGGAGLSAGEFQLGADDGMESFDVTGLYTLDDKGQPVLAPDTGALLNELSDLVEHVCADILMVDPGTCAFLGALEVVLDSRYHTKVKTRAGRGGELAELAFSAKLPFVLINGVDEAKGSVSLKTSPPAQPAP